MRAGIVLSSVLLPFGPAAAQVPSTAAAAAPAAAPAHRVLILLISSDAARVRIAFHHARSLRQGGVDVRVIIQAEASLAYADMLGLVTPEKISKVKEEDKNKPMTDQRTVGNKHLWRPLPPTARKRLDAAVAAGVPVQVDAMGANAAGVLDELRQANVSIVGTVDVAFDLSPFVNQGYQIVTF